MSSALNDFDIAKYYRDHKYFIVGVLEAAEAQQWDYQIPKPCCCNLGKDLKIQEGKPFTKHISWKKAHTLHQELHQVMETYFTTAKAKGSEEALKTIRRQADNVSYELMKQFEAVIEAFGAEKSHLKQLDAYRAKMPTQG